MKHKDSMIGILLLLMILSMASPTRSLVKDSNKMEKHNEVKVGGENYKNGLGEGFFEGRMDFEKTDYSGVGANPEHDPKPPAEV